LDDSNEQSPQTQQQQTAPGGRDGSRLEDNNRQPSMTKQQTKPQEQTPPSKHEEDPKSTLRPQEYQERDIREIRDIRNNKNSAPQKLQYDYGYDDSYDEDEDEIGSGKKKFPYSSRKSNPPRSQGTTTKTPTKEETANTPTKEPYTVEDDTSPIVGTCQDFEKPYSRLTSRPLPTQVRSEPILKTWVPLLLKRYHNKSKDYTYTCDQLRSVRQDLMVQHVRNEFAVEVYETNAKLAIENKDYAEFNVCQTQLKELYSNGISLANQVEFVAYGILYDLLQLDFTHITQQLSTMPETLREHEFIKHAFQVVEAAQTKNYELFRKRYESAPNLAKYFMYSMLEKFVRPAVFGIMLTAYKPSIPVEYLQKELLFKDKEECIAFVKNYGATVTTTNGTEVIKTE